MTDQITAVRIEATAEIDPEYLAAARRDRDRAWRKYYDAIEPAFYRARIAGAESIGECPEIVAEIDGLKHEAERAEAEYDALLGQWWTDRARMGV